MKNMIETLLSQSDRDKIDGFIAQIENVLAGKLAALTEKERSRFGSINEQNKLLVNKVREYNRNVPAMSSPDVDWTEFEADYQARVFLESRSDRLIRIAHQMQSTKILHDNDNYQDSLNDYAYSQYKRGANEAGFAEKVIELKQFFARTGTAKPADGGNNPV